MLDLDAFGEAVRRARAAAEWTQPGLASHAHVSKATIQRVEGGQRTQYVSRQRILRTLAASPGRVHIERYLADGPGASEPLAVCEALFGVTDATVRDAGVVIALPPLKATHLEHVLRTGDYDRELESRKRVAVYARADVRLAECFQKLFWKLGVEVSLCDYLDVDEQSTPFIVFVGWEHVVHLDGVADLGLDAQRIVPLEGGFELDGHTYPAPAANHAVLIEPCISLVPGRSTRAVVIGGSTAAGTDSIAAHVKERGWGELVRLLAEVSPSSLVLWVREEGTRTVRPAQLVPR